MQKIFCVTQVKQESICESKILPVKCHGYLCVNYNVSNSRSKLHLLKSDKPWTHIIFNTTVETFYKSNCRCCYQQEELQKFLPQTPKWSNLSLASNLFSKRTRGKTHSPSFPTKIKLIYVERLINLYVLITSLSWSPSFSPMSVASMVRVVGSEATHFLVDSQSLMHTDGTICLINRNGEGNIV